MAQKDALPMATVFALLFGLLATMLTRVASIGVCYGMVGDSLPSPSDVIKLYQSNGISAMRLYAPESNTLNALKGTGISLMMGVPEEYLPLFANDASAAAKWVQDNIVAYPGVSFKYIVVGNEVPPENAYNILPAMSKIWDAVCNAGFQGKIMVSTAVSSAVFDNTYPPSKSEFQASYNMGPVVNFLAATGNPFFVNIYPYFSYKINYPQISLDYALFSSRGTVVYDGSYQYQNLFDAMVDSAYYALEKAGGSKVVVVVSESGWPSAGNENTGTTVANAQTFNQKLINHVVNGTPKRPGNLETYIFAMFNENKKQGDEVERHFGLFYPDQTPVYSINFK